MSRYLFSFLIAFGIYVLFYIGLFYFFKNNKITLDEPIVNHKISLNHIEMKPIEKEVVEEQIVDNNIQEKIEEVVEEVPKEEILKEQEIKKEVIEEIKEEKVEETPKPILEKKIKKEIKEVQNPKKEVFVKEQIVQKHIQSETVNKRQVNDVPKIDEKKVYLDKHLAQIRDLINQNIKYPSRARKLSIQGIVLVKFKINENGDIENITILDGHKFLQNATIEAINEAAKSFPKTNQSIEIQIPIEYKII